jgi:hypothetical protein
MSFIAWYQFKLFITHASGISMDALHVLAGVLLFLLLAWALKRNLSHPLPWLAVLLLEIGNESYDLFVEIWPDPGSQLGEGFKDILLTMALPTLLLVTARFKPELLGAGERREGA